MCGGCFIADVVGVCVGFFVVVSCEACDAEMFVFMRGHCVTVQSFGVGSVRVAYAASASAQSMSSCVFGGHVNWSCPFLV